MTSKRRIKVVEYDPAWQEEFEREAACLKEVFQSSHVASHHVGSTSITGLLAKPTIDIAIEVAEGINIPTFYPAMEKIGYTCRGECLDAVIPGIPGRFYFVRYRGVEHVTHVHVYQTGHPDLKEKLMFRDYLLTHPDVAAEYGKIKLKLAREYTLDNIGYMRGKDEIVKAIISKAGHWNPAARE